jgi:hypothetical protein
MRVFQLSKNDKSQLVKFINDLEFSRNFKTTNFKKDDIYSLDYLEKCENIAEIILKINSSFIYNTQYIDSIPEVIEPTPDTPNVIEPTQDTQDTPDVIEPTQEKIHEVVVKKTNSKKEKNAK